MKTLSQNLVDTVRTALKGAKLAKFDASIAILNESLAQGAWTPRGSVKAPGGFYQGISKACLANGAVEVCSAEWYATCGVERSLSYGGPVDFMADRREHGLNREQLIALGVKVLREKAGLKLSDEVLAAWFALGEEYRAAKKLLDESRPLPKITPIGLSPKVTKALTEMNLDLDLATVVPAKIDFRMVPGWKWDEKAEKLVPLMEKGVQKLVREYFVVWSKDCAVDASRFAHGGVTGRAQYHQCHACGKGIPSGRFVPVEAFDKKRGGMVGMWLGCDCAAKIFGIKDAGISPGATKVVVS